MDEEPISIEKQMFLQIADELMLNDLVTLSKLFGKECLKNEQGKAFVAFFKSNLVVKLNNNFKINELLSKEGICLWDPSGNNRPMKQWVQIPFEYADQWATLSKLAFIEAADL